MNNIDVLFNQNILDRKLNHFNSLSISHFDEKFEKIKKFREFVISGDLERTKETSIQGLFLERIFKQILGYNTVADGGEYNQTQEHKSVLDSSQADGSLGFFTSKAQDVKAVIELKDANCDLDKKQNRSNHQTPIEQAFSYANKNGSGCGWVIVSNFKEIRLYKSSSSLEYEVFFITDLDDIDKFKKFYYILCKDNLISKNSKSLIDILYNETEQAGNDITVKFYKDYTELRKKLFTSLKENNMYFDDLTLFTKAQKILDRFIFICFCEDKELLPQNVFKQVLQTAEQSFAFTENKIWKQLNGLFHAIDTGNPAMKINHFNGGLFATDEILDKLNIPDDVLIEFGKLSDCDFESEINVNILGHIFEYSISDIEEIKAEINGETVDRNKSSQKTGGIFYTPDYVTKYIVDKTVGNWMADTKENIKKQLLAQNGYSTSVTGSKKGYRKRTITINRWAEIPDESNNKDDEYNRLAIIKLHIDFLGKYSESLKKLRILDPACGSGAFLNATFLYLLEEFTYVNETLSSLQDEQISMLEIDKMILEHNLYGVDINAESVEITKLSLWLLTANKTRTLATLEHSIKVGNSLISDTAVAGDLAFNWNEEFSEIMNNGGFDIVIGNPPYGAKLSQEDKDYLTENYKTTEYNFDTYKTFMELGLKLLKQNGYLGYITPNTYFVLEKGATKLRKYLFENFTMMNVVEMFNVFKTAVVEPAISIFKNVKPIDYSIFEVISVPRNTALTSTFMNDGVMSIFTQLSLREKENYIFNYRETTSDKELRHKIAYISNPLSEYFIVSAGMKPYEVGKGIPPQTKEIVDNKPFTGSIMLDDSWCEYIEGKMIGRFACFWDSAYIKYGEWLAAPRKKEMFKNPKLFIRQTGDYPVATYDDTGKVGKNTIHCIYGENNEISLKYILGLINSKLLKWTFRHDNFHIVGKPLAEMKKVYVERLPIAVADNQNEIVEIVDKLLLFNQNKYNLANHFTKYIDRMYSPKAISEKLACFYEHDFSDFVAELKKQKVNLSASEKMDLMDLFDEKKKELIIIKTQIMNIENDLDNRVYELYNLNDDDIKIINEV